MPPADISGSTHHDQSQYRTRLPTDPPWPFAMRHCVRCGDAFLLTNRYRGNYCPDCHTAWLGRERPADATPVEGPPRLLARRSGRGRSERRATADRRHERTGHDE